MSILTKLNFILANILQSSEQNYEDYFINMSLFIWPLHKNSESKINPEIGDCVKSPLSRD